MTQRSRLAMIAHDQKKDDIVAFAVRHAAFLAGCDIVATGTTGARILEACPQLAIRRMKSGPLGGDQQIGALIAAGEVDQLIFFVDPLTAMPHDVDVKALMRDLKAIGAHNMTTARPRGLVGRARMQRVQSAYEAFRRDGRLPATYEVVYAVAWGAAGRPASAMVGGEAHIAPGAIRRRGAS